MIANNVLSALRTHLRERTRSKAAVTQARPAAVLVPLLGDGDRLDLIFFERSAAVLEHKGEICFPGGSAEAHDSGPSDTALREAHEELALPRELVDVLGYLDDVPTTVSNYVITPVVGHVHGSPQLVADRIEVARIIRVPLARLLEPGVESIAVTEHGGTRRARYAYTFDGNRVWGATARIVHSLLEALR